MDLTVRKLFRRYDEGDAEGAATVFAPEPSFEWFSSPPDRESGDEWDPYNRETVAAYLAAGYDAGYRIEIEEVTVSDPQGGTSQFSMELRRTAGPPTATLGEFRGKGAFDCTTGLIIVMSLGEPT